MNLCLHHHVHAPVGSVTLGFGVEAHHLEDEAHRIVEIQFGIARKLVVLARKQGLQTLHELFGLAGLNPQDEIHQEAVAGLA